MSLVGFFSPSQIWTAAGNANINLAQPDPRAGDLMVASISVRPSSVTLTPPAGWDTYHNLTATDGLAEGADTGSVRFYTFTKVADGSEGVSNATFTKAGTASVINGNIQQTRSRTGTYEILALGGSINADATSWVISGLGGPGDFQEDDLVIMYAAQNGDVSNTTSWDFHGVDLGASTKTTRYEHGEFATTTGNDQETGLAVARVLPGNSNTSTVSLAVTQSVACSGVLAALRIREGAGTPREDVWVRGTGVQLAGTTSMNVPYVEHAVGDRLLLIVIGKHSTDGNFTTPTNWTLLGTWVGGSGGVAADSGNVRTSIFYRDITTIQNTTQTVSFPTGNVMIGQMVAVANDTGRPWESPVITGGGRTVQDPWSLLLANSIEFPDDSVILMAFGVNTDAMTGAQNPSLSVPGATIGDVTVTAWWETTTGNDAAIALATARVVSGSVGTPTVGIDFLGAPSTNYPAGSIGLVVLNAEPIPPTTNLFFKNESNVWVPVTLHHGIGWPEVNIEAI